MYRVGIIGCGRVGGFLEHDPLRGHPCTHGGGYRACSKTEIVAACDINRERLERFGEEFGIKRLYKDYKEMLKNEDLDIVSICTWTDTHTEMIIECSAMGVKGVICEKPMALTLKDADRAIQACRDSGTKLIINHERRWDSYYLKAKELIEDGMIGELRTIVGNVLTSAPSPGDWHAEWTHVGGGPLLHDGTHLMDMIRFFAGEVDWVIGHVERRTKGIHVEDIAYAFIQFKNGVHAIIEGGGLREYYNFELDIQGSNGRILIGNEIQRLWIRQKSRHYSGFMALEERPFPPPEEIRNPWVAQVEEMISCLENGGESISNGEDGRAALELVMAVYESARLGGAKVTLPLDLSGSPLDQMIQDGIL